MKLRLFILLSVLFLCISLLMPVGVYASEPTLADLPVVTTNIEGEQAAVCGDSEAQIVETVAVEDGTASPTDAPESDSQCDDDDGGFARVSWNS